MALVRCKSCGIDTSDSLEHCPACRAPLRAGSASPLAGLRWNRDVAPPPVPIGSPVESRIPPDLPSPLPTGPVPTPPDLSVLVPKLPWRWLIVFLVLLGALGNRTSGLLGVAVWGFLIWLVFRVRKQVMEGGGLGGSSGRTRPLDLLRQFEAELRKKNRAG